MTDQELKDLVASLAVMSRETDRKMQETDRKMQETKRLIEETSLQMKETDRKMQETDRQMQETDRKWAESSEKWDKSSEKWDKLSEKWDKMNSQMSGINDNMGYHAEQFFQDIFGETLTFAGKKYDKMISNLECKGKIPNGEFDIVLVNCKNIAIIEVKNRIHPNFVKELVEKKVDRFRDFFPEYVNRKLYLGIAGFSFSKAVPEKAKQYGVGIIRQVGKSIEIDAKNLKAY